jgi:hypothetical protein
MTSNLLYSDITGFLYLIHSVLTNNKKIARQQYILALKSDKDLQSVFINSRTGKQIFKHESTKVLEHELSTAIKLTDINNDVIFTPKGMFKRGEKRFDIYLLRNDESIIRADLKTNIVPTKNAIYKLIQAGDKQADNIVLDIHSSIKSENLIQGLKEGLKSTKNLKSVLLFYKRKYYYLNTKTIMSKRIYKILK